MDEELRQKLIDAIDDRRFDKDFPSLLYKDIQYIVDKLLPIISSYSSTPKKFKVLITNGGCTPIENVDHAHLEDVVWEDGHMVSAVLVAENLSEVDDE